MKHVCLSEHEVVKICKIIIAIDELQMDDGLFMSDSLNEAKRLLIETIQDSELRKEKEP